MMIEIGAYLNRNIEIAASEGLRDDELLIMPAGRVELFNMEDVILDEAGAQSVLAAFRERGVDIPVDYEHSTKLKAYVGEESPAAGWITSMHWDADRGLIGSVNWTPRALKQIKDKEYKYASPHFDVDRGTRRVEFVMAVALTNTPRICNMEQLIAASVAASNRSESISGENEMDKKMRKRMCASLKLEDGATDDQILAAMDEAVDNPDAGGEPEVSPEDQAVIAVKSMLMDLQRMLMEANVITPEASLSDAVQAAMDLIGKPADEPAEEAAASIAASLGMSGKPTTAEMVASIQERIANTVPATALKKVQEQVASLTAERTERKATEIVGSLIEDGKLNPHDEANMTKVLDYNDIQWRWPGQASGFYGRNWSPTWGGTGGPSLSQEQFMYLDSWYMSGIKS